MGLVTEHEGCRWIHGDVRSHDWHYCNAEKQRGKPYCAEHCEQAYLTDEETGEKRLAAAARTTGHLSIGGGRVSGLRR